MSTSMCRARECQAEADGYAAKRTSKALSADAERDQPDNEQYRSSRRNIERQNLHDQRRADIGPEHDASAGTRLTTPSAASDVS